jgi:hypothetical protein
VNGCEVNGWEASLTEYPWKWFGATFDVSGAYANPTIKVSAKYFREGVPPTDVTLSNAIHTSAYTLMFGPSFAYRKSRRAAVRPCSARWDNRKSQPYWKGRNLTRLVL